MKLIEPETAFSRRNDHRHSVVSSAAVVLAACVLVFVAKIFVQPAEGTSDGERAMQSGSYSQPAHWASLKAPSNSAGDLFNGYASASEDSRFEKVPNDEVLFSRLAGCYQSGFQLQLKAPEGWRITYTLDGSEPTSFSEPYDYPIIVDRDIAGAGKLTSAENASKLHLTDFSTAFVPEEGSIGKAVVVRARAFSPDGRETDVATRTFFIGDDLVEEYNDVAVVALTVDPQDLLDYNRGIYAPGKTYDDWKLTQEGIQAIVDKSLWAAPGNYSQRGREWERPANMELFDGENSCSLAIPCGIRIHGGASRCNDQKSLNIYFRKDYGMKTANYGFFEGEKDLNGDIVNTYKSLTLRTGGNDTEYIKFKDSYLQDMISDLDIETQSARPAVLFVNGEYWGCYSLMEKYSDDDLANLYGLDKDNVILAKDGEIDDGQDSDAELYAHLMEYADRDLSDELTWHEFESEVDVQSLADYFAAQIYIGNVDYLPIRNYAVWRTRVSDASSPKGDCRWRWLVYDTEYSSGLYPYPGDVVNPGYDSLMDAAVNHPLFASALANQHFREIFTSSLRQVGTQCLDYDRAMARLQDYLDVWHPLMPTHYARFGNTSWAYQPNIDSMSHYLRNRGGYIVGQAESDLSDFGAFSERVQERRAEVLGIPQATSQGATPMLLPVLIEPEEDAEQAEAGVGLAEQLAEQVQQGIAEDVAHQ